MELGTILGLAASALGIGIDLTKPIKEKFSKKILVTPNSIETTSRHWDSTNSVIIQNKTSQPLFSIQVVFWHEKNQTLKFKFDKVEKEAEVKDIIINYGVIIYRGNVGEEKFAITEILRLMPNESIEVDLSIEKKGVVKIFPVSYDDKMSKQVLNSDNRFAYPFTPPFKMQLSSIDLSLKKKS